MDALQGKGERVGRVTLTLTLALSLILTLMLTLTLTTTLNHNLNLILNRCDLSSRFIWVPPVRKFVKKAVIHKQFVPWGEAEAETIRQRKE